MHFELSGNYTQIEKNMVKTWTDLSIFNFIYIFQYLPHHNTVQVDQSDQLDKDFYNHSDVWSHKINLFNERSHSHRNAVVLVGCTIILLL